MATELERLVVRIEADARQLKKELGLLDRSTRRAGSRAEKSFKGFDRQVKNTGRSILNLRNALIALGIGATIRGFLRTADTMKLLQGRLRLVTTGTSNLAEVQGELFDVAQETRSSFESTVELYARVARSAETLGTSQSELLDITELTNKAIQISGATSAEASAGVIQFSQALASSRLSGDELRSVLEQMPRLARAISDGLDVDIGALRALGEAGELSAQKVIGAILSQQEKLRKEFEQLPRTVSQAFTQLKNELLLTTGEVDSATGATSEFIEALDQLREIISSDSFKRGFDATASGVALIGKVAASAVESVGDLIEFVNAGLINDRMKENAGDLVLLQKALEDALVDLETKQGEKIVDVGRIKQINSNIELLTDKIKESKAQARLLRVELNNLVLSDEQRAQLGGLPDEERRFGITVEDGDGLTDDQREALADIDAFIAALERQNATLGFSKTALAQLAAEEKLLAIAKKGDVTATQDQIDTAKLLVAIRADEENKTEILAELEQKRTDRLDEGREAIEGAATAEQQLADETLRLIKLVPTLTELGLSLGEAMEVVRANSDKAAESLGILKTADDKLSDSQQRVVDGAQDIGLSFSSAFEDAVVEGENLREVLNGLEKDIIRILIRKTITEPITNKISDFITQTFSGGTSDAGVAGLGTAAATAIVPVQGMAAAATASIAPLTALAAAASAAAGTEVAGAVTKGAASAAILGFASGGIVRGAGTGTSDSNLVALSDGEFVVNARAAAANLDALRSINSGRVPRLASGGSIGGVNNSRSVVVGDINIFANDAEGVRQAFSRRQISRIVAKQAQAGVD